MHRYRRIRPKRLQQRNRLRYVGRRLEYGVGISNTFCTDINRYSSNEKFNPKSLRDPLALTHADCAIDQ
jgi:hypothetical protein